MSVGKKLKKVLKEKKLKQYEFALAIDENITQVNKVLNDQRFISYEMLDKIMKFFPDLDMNWLLREDASQRNFVNETEEAYVAYRSPEKMIADIEKDLQLLKASFSKK